MTTGHYPLKRVVDLSVLALVAVPAGFVGALAVIAIKATSPGPALFKQVRAGQGGYEFECLKFRTMIHGENPLIPADDRITTVGRWLRRFSLDELPQLVNVARGEMSIVGPRPMLPFQADRCDERQRGRLTVRPGLTGWAQINGRNGLSWPQRIELDLDYVERQAAALDLQIIAGTASALLSGSGVGGHDAEDPFVAPPDHTDA